MAAACVFNIDPASLKLGAILARGSPGVILYQAELQLGKHATQVYLTPALRLPVHDVFEQL